MKIVAINGSHRSGEKSNTGYLIELALEQAREAGIETELIELADCNIEYCKACNRCLFKPECSIQDDDMAQIVEKLMEADGILFASPNYFANVTAKAKNFMDRTRPLHMTANLLKNKVAGFLVMSGLDNTGAEAACAALQRWCDIHELLVVHPRTEGPVLGCNVIGSLRAGVEDGVPQWRRSVAEDPIAPLEAAQLGRDMAALIKKLA